MRNKTTWILAALTLVILCQTPTRVSAQGRHVVTIENGHVYIDSRRVPRSELPASLRSTRFSANFNFSGDALIELNGTVYQLLEGKLVEADDELAREGHLMVFFRDPDNQDDYVRVLRRATPFPNFYTTKESDGVYNVVMKDYYEAMSEQARAFEKLQVTITDATDLNRVKIAGELRIQAENAARIAGAFPKIEFESYLEGIHERDTHLYTQLLREREMERETHRLAMEALSTTDDEQRGLVVDKLRNRLVEIFELKQENRRKEIEQLSKRLEELRSRLDERAELKKRIIDSRLKELLGELNW